MPALKQFKTSNFKFQISFRGFTLIELMVTISIIAVIAAVGITSYSQAQKLGRDSKRKQDLRSIAVALELYKQKYGHFPCTPAQPANPWQNSTSTSNTFWIINDHTAGTGCGDATHVFNSSFISNMPIGPLSTNGEYTYTSSYNTCGAPGVGFWMFTTLENGNDPDANAQKLYRDCSGTILDPQAWGTNQFMVFSH